MKRVAIFGATGYTGFELIRLLLSHPGVKLSVLTSEQYSSQSLEQAFPPFKGKLAGVSFGTMERLLPAEFDVAFLALPHTLSSAVAGSLLSRGIPVVDLSADFRFRSIPLYESVYGVAHKSPALAAKAVYGLPEIHRAAIRKTRLAAVPGCFPTSVILGLYPLLEGGLIDRKGIVADCTTRRSRGASGRTGSRSTGITRRWTRNCRSRRGNRWRSPSFPT
jgi:N-acetyl-gamma-glutamyl-phosphate reductase